MGKIVDFILNVFKKYLKMFYKWFANEGGYLLYAYWIAIEIIDC